EQPGDRLDPLCTRQQVRRARVAKHVRRDRSPQHPPSCPCNLSRDVLPLEVLPRSTLEQVRALGVNVEDSLIELLRDPPCTFLPALAVEPELHCRAVGL